MNVPLAETIVRFWRPGRGAVWSDGDVPVLAEGTSSRSSLHIRSGPYGSASKLRSLSAACRHESLFLELPGVYVDLFFTILIGKRHRHITCMEYTKHKQNKSLPAVYVPL